MSEVIHTLPGTQWVCIRHNRRAATLALIFSLGVLLGGTLEATRWFPSSLPGPDPFMVRLGIVDGAAALFGAFLSVRCVYERLWLGIAAAGSAIMVLRSFHPGLAGPGSVGLGLLVLLPWVAAAVVSLGFVRSAFETPPSGGAPQPAASGGGGGT
jgi:hypothetical protein